MTNMTNESMPIEKMPKVELHRHLELSLRPSTIRELAPKHGIDVSDEATFKQRFIIDQPMRDLGAVLNKFLDTQLLLDSEQVLERIAFEACEDAYREGIRILELRYAPTFVRDRHDNLTFESIHEAFVRGVRKAEATYPMAVGLICIIQRILPVAEAEAVTAFAIEHKDTFIGLDLADNEAGFDSKPFSPFFMRAKEAGMGITVHAGEINTDEAPGYVRDAAQYLGATRIGHGLQIYKSPEMIQYAIQHNLVLELCPTSNYLTQAVPGGLDQHPFRKLMQAGVPVTINTDDPGIFATNMNREYHLLREHFHLTDADFATCNDTAAAASFISLEKRQAVWPRLIS